MPTVADLMTPDVVAASPDATMADVARLLRDRGVECVVLLQYEQVVGVLTDRDLVVLGLAAGRDPGTAARDLGRDAVTLGTDMEADEARNLLRSKALRSAPVVDAGGKAQGFCSLADLDAPN